RRALAGAAGVGRAGRAALSDAHPRGGAGRLPGGAHTRGPLTPAGIELLGGRRSAAQGSRDERGTDRGARAPGLSVSYGRGEVADLVDPAALPPLAPPGVASGALRLRRAPDHRRAGLRWRPPRGALPGGRRRAKPRALG